MNTCPVITLDLDSPYATLLGAKSPTEQSNRGVDWGKWLACQNTGIVISSAVWTIHPDDDDTTLVLGMQLLSDDISSVQISGGTVGQSYRLICTATLDDGQVIPATVQIPVRDVYKQALAA